METFKLLAQDSVETGITGIAGAIGHRLIYGESYPNFKLPVLSYLNDIQSMYVYGAIFAGSNAIGNITGDFILPLVSSSKLPSQINKITSPLTTGVISLGLLMALTMQIPTVNESLQAILLGATANLTGRYLSGKIIGNNWDSQLLKINTPSLPTVNSVQPNSSSMMTGPSWFGSGDFNQPYGFSF